MRSIIIITSFLLLVFSCSEDRNKKEQTSTTFPFQENINTRWKLVSPDPGPSCELRLIFLDSGKMNLSFKGEDHVGLYEVDNELSNYLRIKVVEKDGWDQDCLVNPQYLSFYDDYTEFSWSRVDDYLYFKRSEKVMKFERILQE